MYRYARNRDLTTPRNTTHMRAHSDSCRTVTSFVVHATTAFMDWYVVIKKIQGRRYRYRQKTWRENGRVRTRSEYIGLANDEPSGVTLHASSLTTELEAKARSVKTPIEFDLWLSDRIRRTRNMDKLGVGSSVSFDPVPGDWYCQGEVVTLRDGHVEVKTASGQIHSIDTKAIKTILDREVLTEVNEMWPNREAFLRWFEKTTNATTDDFA
jgi:hypothetical protein